MKYCDFKRGFDNLCPENLDAWIPVSHALQIDLDCTKVKFITIYHKFVSLNWYMLFWSVTSIRPFCTICINIIILFSRHILLLWRKNRGSEVSPIIHFILLKMFSPGFPYLVQFATVPFHADWLSTRQNFAIVCNGNCTTWLFPDQILKG